MSRSRAAPSGAVISGIALNIIAVLYLAVELGFNAQLTDIAGGAANADALHATEIWGRTIAGFGAALITLRLGLGILRKRRIGAAPVIAVGLAAIAGVGVYVGQRALIDEIVARASPETRRSALTLALMRQALQTGDLTLDRAPLDPGDPAAKTLIATSGLIGWARPDLVGDFNTNLASYTEQLVESRFDFDSAYARYRKAGEGADAAWRDYEKADKARADAAANPRKTASDLWARFADEADAGWRGAVDARGKLTAAVQNALGYHFMLGKYFENPTARQSEYDAMMAELSGGKAIDPKIWCAATCPGSVDYVRRTISRIGREALEEQSGMTLSASKDEFLASPAAEARLKEALGAEGLSLPAGWRGAADNPREAFIASLEGQIPAYAERKFLEATNGRLRPGLDRAEFDALPGISAAAREALQLAPDAPFRFGWSRGEFESALWEGSLSLAAERMAADTRASDEILSDPEAPVRRRADAALRSVIVPPLAMAFSLFFGLSNLISLILSALPKTAAGTAGAMALAPHLFRPAILAALIALPLFIPSRASTLLDAGERAPLPIQASVRWLGVMEPALYPVASRVRAILPPVFGFEAAPW